MNKIFNSAFGLVLAAIVTTWVVGCGSDSKPEPRPTKTITYTESLQEGGPGFVDVYEPTTATTTALPSSSRSLSE